MTHFKEEAKFAILGLSSIRADIPPSGVCRFGRNRSIAGTSHRTRCRLERLAWASGCWS